MKHDPNNQHHDPGKQHDDPAKQHEGQAVHHDGQPAQHDDPSKHHDQPAHHESPEEAHPENGPSPASVVKRDIRQDVLRMIAQNGLYLEEDRNYYRNLN